MTDKMMQLSWTLTKEETGQESELKPPTQTTDGRFLEISITTDKMMQLSRITHVNRLIATYTQGTSFQEIDGTK